MADPRSWINFERLVTAIHKLADEGAKVRWNEKIAGRQFDVTIRFKKGLYQYLTVIECKDYSRPVPVGEVDAFVTKSADARADRGVMASSSGFQAGAKEVAARHNITLVHVSDSQDVDLSAFGAQQGEDTDVLHVKKVALEYTDSERKDLPIELNALTYFANQVVIEMDGLRTRLGDLVGNHAQNFLGGPHDEYRDHVIALPTDAIVVAPEDEEIPRKGLARIHIQAALTRAKTLSSPVVFDPYLLMPEVQVKDLSTGETQTFSPHDLALGVDTVFEEGKFYENPQLASYYYCDQIQDGRASMYLVESYQLGTLVPATLVMQTKHANRYVEVSDKTVLRRLGRRLKKLEAANESA